MCVCVCVAAHIHTHKHPHTLTHIHFMTLVFPCVHVHVCIGSMRTLTTNVMNTDQWIFKHCSILNPTVECGSRWGRGWNTRWVGNGYVLGEEEEEEEEGSLAGKVLVNDLDNWMNQLCVYLSSLPNWAGGAFMAGLQNSNKHTITHHAS